MYGMWTFRKIIRLTVTSPFLISSKNIKPLNWETMDTAVDSAHLMQVYLWDIRKNRRTAQLIENVNAGRDQTESKNSPSITTQRGILVGLQYITPHHRDECTFESSVVQKPNRHWLIEMWKKTYMVRWVILQQILHKWESTYVACTKWMVKTWMPHNLLALLFWRGHFDGFNLWWNISFPMEVVSSRMTMA